MAAIPATLPNRAYPSDSAEMGGPDYVIISGSFETNGSSEITNVRGEGFQAERAGDSIYTVTFGRGWPMMVSFTCSIEAASDALYDGAITSTPYVSSTGKVKMYIIDPSTGAAPGTEPDGPRVNFTAVLHRRNALSKTYTA